MKIMILIFIVITFNFSVFAQQGLEGTTVRAGFIKTIDTDTISTRLIVFSKDSIKYYLTNSKDPNVMALNDVSEVFVYDGNYSTTGIWIGGIVGLGIGVATSLALEETTISGFVETTTIPLWPVYLFPVVGAVIGYAIGQNIDDWDVVYKESATLLKNFDIKQNNLTGLVLSYRVYF